MSNETAHQVLRFKDRTDAGDQLAQRLIAYQNGAEIIVVGLPRGGVPVAYQVASTLHLPLEIIIVRKLGMPSHKEFAIGAIASGGARYLQDEVIRAFSVPKNAIELVQQEELIELERRERLYRENRPAISLLRQTVIVVDDGLATGSTMKVAVQAIRKQHPKRIIVAVPVASLSAIESLQTEADEVISLSTPEPLFAVGQWYDKFNQTSDKEVIQLLRAAQQFETKKNPIDTRANVQ